MSSIKYKKINRVIHRGISLNPHMVTVIEKGKVLVDGAYENINSTRNITCVVYPMKTNLIKVDSDVKATSFKDNNMEMICDENADIKNNSRIRTTIECVEGNFTVTYVNPIVVEDEIAGYQCGLERID